jgi:hypothetical protein
MSRARTQPMRREDLPKGHKSVPVYGPQGSGKTRHAEALRKHFDLQHVQDEWWPGKPWPMTDTLVLSCNAPPEDMRRAIPIHTALAMLKANAPGYPF